MLAALALIAATSAAAVPSQRPPPLTGGVFFELEFVRRIGEGSFDPNQYHTARPKSLRFGPRKLTIDLGQETADHVYRVVKKDSGWAIEIKLDGQWREHSWHWDGRDRAETSLLDGGSVALVRLPWGYDRYQKEHDKRFTRRELKRLAGKYRSERRNLVVSKQGELRLEGELLHVKAERCFESCERARPATCLRTGRGPIRRFALRAGVLIEVPPESELCTIGPAFAVPDNARPFVRVDKK